MKKGLLIAAILVCGGALSWYFLFRGESSRTLNYVPQKSSIVFLIDPLSCYEKGNIKNITNSYLWNKAKEEEDMKEKLTLIEGIIKDPKNSGVDLKEKFVFFMKAGQKSDQMLTGFTVALSDKAKFAELVKKMAKDEKIQKGTGYEFIRHEDSKTVFGWNDDVAMIFATSRDRKSLMDNFDSVLNKKQGSINDNSLFKKFKKDKGDITMFVNSEMPLHDMDFAGILNFKKIPQFASGAAINFEKGKITLTSKYYFNSSEDEKKFEVLAKDKGINSLELMCSSYPIMMINLNLNFPKVIEIVSMLFDKEDPFEQMAKSIGITKDDLVKSFTGQITLTFEGMKKDSIETRSWLDDTMVKREVTLPVLSFFVGVKDMKAPEKMMKMMNPQVDGNKFIFSFFGMNVTVVKHEKGLVLLTDPTAANKLASGEKLSDGKFGELSATFDKGSATAYLELETSKWNSTTRDILRAQMRDGYIVMDSVLANLTHGKSWNSDKSMGSYGELNFRDQNKNALQQFFEIIDNAAKLSEQLEQKREDEMMSEEMMQEMPAVTEEVK